MNEPTTKQELLDAIESTHQDMVRMLAALSDEEKSAPILDEGWSIKDSLAHLIDWEKMTMDWLTQSLQGQTVRRFVPGFQYDTEDEREPVMARLNDHLYAQNKDRSVGDVMRDFRATHRAIFDLTAQMAEDDIFDPNRFPWRNGSPAADLLGNNTWRHYAEHQGWITEGRARQRAYPTTKAELLRRNRERHAAMETLLAGLTAEQMTAPALDSGWSVKDSLAHLSAWETLMLRWIGQYRRGEEVKRIAEGFLVGENDAEEQMHKYNQFLFEQNKARDLTDVLDEFRTVYQRVTDQIESMSEDEIFDPNYFPARKGSALVAPIASDAYEHYDEHIGWIKRAFGSGD